jgi:DNA modification methylase
VKPYYDDGRVTIYHGDCRDILLGLQWDVVVTDPPYPGREDLFATEAVDLALSTALSGGRPGFVFWPCLIAYPVRTPDAVHIWHKAVPIHPKSVTGNVPGHQYERILAYGVGRRCEVFRIAAVLPKFAACAREFAEHPTQKPVTLLRELVGRAPHGVMLDAFCGTGTTLRAAKDLGRRAIGIEIEERYCEIAAERMGQEVLDVVGV